MLPQDVRGNAVDSILQLDPEDSAFQSSFSKLGASENEAKDPVPEVADPQQYLSKQLAAKSASKPGVVSGKGALLAPERKLTAAFQLAPLMAQVPENVAGPFAQYMRSQGSVRGTSS